MNTIFKNRVVVADVMIVVVRYFGGIKLGAGGLTRAYGHAAQAVMEILPTEQQIELDVLSVTCDFSLEQSVRHWLLLVEGSIESVEYAQKVTMKLSLPKLQTEDFIKKLNANRCQHKLLD
ncbi:YigZ family protein [Thiomicrorhabdus lithotrophica]|uniref:YigZ family protein n=1 Tax=Thiomicrorhabdus lithotrophica TaxID=2949997 RepID=A0ABY8C9J2_9GAMM|nr:YigZ family protein [Thiomicrorhabdus lithotrophica]WEJ62634.1 YigZ family protein [Thiomicrorhabdus lithotrophica]